MLLRVVVAAAAALSVSLASDTPFSPLSTFYNIDVSTLASYYAGKEFGPGCARGGVIPDGFIAVAMSGTTMGMKHTADICGMCVAIKGPAPTSANAADNVGVVGEYYGYVYEVCNDCTQTSGVQLGIPGSGQTSVTWRAIPCPNATTSPFLFFDETSADRARFQVRGLSAPIISATVANQTVSNDGPFLVVQRASHGSVFPFTIDVVTALGEQVAVQVPAYRENGAMTDLISVAQKAPARSTAVMAPNAQSQYGSGEITTVSGPQFRTVRTTTQAGRQVVTITTGQVEDVQRSGPRRDEQPLLVEELVDPDDVLLNRPIDLDDVGIAGGAGRYEQIRVPTGHVAFPSPRF